MSSEYFATTTVAVWRGTGTTDPYGDTVDGGTAVATGLWASVVEDVTATDPEPGGDVQTVVTAIIRLPRGSDVQAGDRLKDETTAAWYTARTVEVVRLPAGTIKVNAERL